MARVKAIFKNVKDFEKTEFKNSRCLLTISVGQDTHDGERFGAIVDLVNVSFNSCIISLHDSLQRYTMALNRSEDASFFHNLAIQEGDLWLARNKKHYERLINLEEITRWDAWMRDSQFNSWRSKILALISSDPHYKEAFDISVGEFVKKYHSRIKNAKNFDIERARKLSFEFVVEECAAFCLLPKLQCQFEAYPNAHNAAIEETRKKFISQYYPDLLRGVTIYFRNSGQLKPQHFELLKT